jgi:hypothetical protein
MRRGEGRSTPIIAAMPISAPMRMRSWRPLLLPTLLALSACQALQPIDPMQETKFTAEPDGRTFNYVGFAENTYSKRTKEPERLAILERWLRQNAMCRAGYKITAKRDEKRPTDAYNIYYAGRCN